LTAIFLLAERETEIKMFAPRKRWRLMVELGVNNKKLKAHLEKAPGVPKDGLIRDIAQGKELVARIQDRRPFIIDQIERAALILGTPVPYALAELLNDAQVLCGFPPRKTVAILKNLAAGVDVQGKWQALISSMAATKEDCVDLLSALEKTATALFGEENKGGMSPEWSPGVLLPLEPELDREALKSALDDDSLKVYELLRGRALASQMRCAAGESIKVQLSSGDAVFHAHLNSITQQGFLLAHQGRHGRTLLEPCPFVDLQEGQQLEALAVVPEPAAGISAEHYTYETLFAELADFSVTAEPHNVMLLQGLIDHDYITVSPDGSLVAGQNAELVAALMKRAFPKMSGINLSAYIEQTVNEVLSGRKGLDFALKQFGQTLMIQGKVLIKAKLSPKVPLKTRPSSAIIKQGPGVASPSEAKPIAPRSGESTKDQYGPGSPDVVETSSGEEGLSSREADAVAGQDIEVQDVPQESEAAETAGLDLAVEAQVFEVTSGKDEEPGEEPPGAEGNGGEEVSSAPVWNEEKDGSAAEEKGPAGESEAFADTGLAGGAEAELAALDAAGELVETDQSKICRVCGKAMILKKDQFGRFWSCAGFPLCRHSEAFSAAQGLPMTCPVCGTGEIIVKRTPTGKTFYVCLEAECEFMSWSEPHPLVCQVCESPYLVEKKSASGKTYLRCPRAGCNYVQALPGESGTDLLDEKIGAAEGPVRKKVRVVRRAQGTAGGGATKKVRVVRRRK
jgi:ssDNA-binding Zn-finger/Zn-ribbon topoisomerase 1